MSTAPLIAYYRVSTDRQGRSGLGLDAQREAVERYAATSGGQLVAEYTEIESGKRNDRPELAAALADCKKQRATLVIAKLDRLGRNVAFIATLMESGADFVACDNPHASKLMLHMLAAFAEHERDQISQRTKAALATLKARGVQLGNPRLDELNAVRQAKREAFALGLAETVEELRRGGITSQRAIAAELNARGVQTLTGKGKWHPRTVREMLGRASQ